MIPHKYADNIQDNSRNKNFQLIEEKEQQRKKGRISRLAQWNIRIIIKSYLSYNLAKKIKKKKFKPTLTINLLKC